MRIPKILVKNKLWVAHGPPFALEYIDNETYSKPSDAGDSFCFLLLFILFSMLPRSQVGDGIFSTSSQLGCYMSNHSKVEARGRIPVSALPNIITTNL